MIYNRTSLGYYYVLYKILKLQLVVCPIQWQNDNNLKKHLNILNKINL